jgi:3-dehydroquinate synthase
MSGLNASSGSAAIRIDVRIDAPDHGYPIYVGAGLLSDLTSMVDLSRYVKLFILTDTNVGAHYLPVVLRQCAGLEVVTHTVPAGEDSKCLRVYEEVQSRLSAASFDRGCLMVNLGGGVVSDLGGFVASTYMRGFDFVNITTTLEGMVDASVGGKNGINLNAYKNYLGTFAQPRAVLIDVDTLDTLPERALVAGWAEVVKHGLIAGDDYYRQVTARRPLEYSKTELVEIIARSCEIKRSIVQADERESGLRKVLNFGHTVGHAIEALSYEHEHLLHGEAVAIGMVAEGYLSVRAGHLSTDDYETMVRRLERSGLPTRAGFRLSDRGRLMRLIAGDKKNRGGAPLWSLIGPVGHVRYDQIVDPSIVDEALSRVV